MGAAPLERDDDFIKCEFLRFVEPWRVPSIGTVAKQFESPCEKIKNEPTRTISSQGGTGDRAAEQRRCECLDHDGGSENSAKSNHIDGDVVKQAYPLLWEGSRAKSRHLDPIRR
ncbi:MAG: hypothetical protein RLZZ245_990 [Verrucomicrobiota bacterium]